MYSKKSVFFTYLLWLCGGMFGLHHFYLGRDLQGILWWLTLGGYFGCGWIRDLVMIPEYVKDANKDAEYMAKLSQKMRFYEKPPVSSLRFGGAIVVAYLFATIVGSAIPKDEFLGFNWTWLQPIFVPIACALGVWAVGNIGHEEGGIFWALFGAYATYPIYHKYNEDLSFTLMVAGSAAMFDWRAKKWRRKVKPNKSLVHRVTIVGSCVCLFVFLIGCNIYFNGTIEMDGEEIPIHEAIRHFFTSPWWTDLWQSLQDTFAYARVHGWAEVWRMIVELSDPTGEYNAYKVLELDSGVNQTTINTKCRQLSMKWHPDKIKDPNLKVEAQEKFYEVQQACEILSTNKAKRRKKNKKSTA